MIVNDAQRKAIQRVGRQSDDDDGVSTGEETRETRSQAPPPSRKRLVEPHREWPLLTLVRHAQTTANVARVLQGSTDSPLTPLGEAQRQRLARAVSRAAKSSLPSGRHDNDDEGDLVGSDARVESNRSASAHAPYHKSPLLVDRPPTRLVSSPQPRARATAEAMHEALLSVYATVEAARDGQGRTDARDTDVADEGVVCASTSSAAPLLPSPSSSASSSTRATPWPPNQRRPRSPPPPPRLELSASLAERRFGPHREGTRRGERVAGFAAPRPGQAGWSDSAETEARWRARVELEASRWLAELDAFWHARPRDGEADQRDAQGTLEEERAKAESADTKRARAEDGTQMVTEIPPKRAKLDAEGEAGAERVGDALKPDGDDDDDDDDVVPTVVATTTPSETSGTATMTTATTAPTMRDAVRTPRTPRPPHIVLVTHGLWISCFFSLLPTPLVSSRRHARRGGDDDGLPSAVLATSVPFAANTGVYTMALPPPPTQPTSQPPPPPPPPPPGNSEPTKRTSATTASSPYRAAAPSSSPPRSLSSTSSDARRLWLLAANDVSHLASLPSSAARSLASPDSRQRTLKQMWSSSSSSSASPSSRR